MIRIGCGFDAHAFVAGRPLVLAGVVVPHPFGLAGHSDADVVTHAVVDALLGAAGLGDIGRHFPDDDDAYKNINSQQLLGAVAAKLKARGIGIGNIDATVVLQKPKLREYLGAMQTALAATLDIAVARVHLKATSTEKLGFVGREEGIAAFAVALVNGAEDISNTIAGDDR